MAIQRKIQYLMNDIEHRDLKRDKGSQHMSILFYSHDAHWVSWELYRKELAQVFMLSKSPWPWAILDLGPHLALPHVRPYSSKTIES
jgi:hypothetical protein